MPAFVVRLVALAGCVGAHRLHATHPALPRGFDLIGPVSHIRDGDTIEVSGVPVWIANLDCAELGTAPGNHANAVMRRWASGATASCQLEGRMSYDRQVGVCRIDGVGDLGEAMIRAGACTRW